MHEQAKWDKKNSCQRFFSLPFFLSSSHRLVYYRRNTILKVFSFILVLALVVYQLSSRGFPLPPLLQFLRLLASLNRHKTRKSRVYH
jgi:hypothetical protein